MTNESVNDAEPIEVVAEVLPAPAKPLVESGRGRVFDPSGRRERPGHSQFERRKAPSLRGLLWGGLLVVGAAFVLFGAGVDPVAWLGRSGPFGMLVCVVIVAMVTPIFVPSGLMAIVPGYLWGAGLGTATILVGALLGGWLNMWLARRFVGPRVERWVAHNPVLMGLRDAIRVRGFRLALALRLSPVTPYSMLAYLAGITGLGPMKFGIASVLGGIPWTFVYATAGALFASSTTSASLLDVSVEGPQWLRWFGLALTTAVALWVGRLARAELMRAAHVGES